MPDVEKDVLTRRKFVLSFVLQSPIQTALSTCSVKLS